MLKLLALFIFVPFVELVLLLQLAKYTSISFALGLIVLTGVTGTILARHQGWRTMRSIQQSLSAGQLPTESLLDAAMIFFAGALLLTPGMLTDLFGLSLLVPFCRGFYRLRLKRWFRRNFKVQSFQTPSAATGFSAGEPNVVDSYMVDEPGKIDNEDD